MRTISVDRTHFCVCARAQEMVDNSWNLLTFALDLCPLLHQLQLLKTIRSLPPPPQLLRSYSDLARVPVSRSLWCHTLHASLCSPLLKSLFFFFSCYFILWVINFKIVCPFIHFFSARFTFLFYAHAFWKCTDKCMTFLFILYTDHFDHGVSSIVRQFGGATVSVCHQ